jgi:alcohol dehydrogenase/propanol-preferring alcohol dehydrogenase
MKSYKIIENGKPLKQVEIDKPVPVGDEILVKTVSCGVCHSDVHIYEGFFDLGGGAKLPSPAKDLAMGHEVFGEVVELGENVKDLEVGKKYVVYPWIGCGKCEVCLSGNEHYCGITTNRNIGITRDGGYGEYVLVPDKKYLFDAGDTHDDLAGSYACRGLTAYSAIKKANLTEGQKSVVVVGAGGMGLLSLRILKAVYDINPIVVDIDDEKLAIAMEAGASAAINSSDEDAAMKIFEITGGGAKSVIDFVGAAPAFEFAYGLFGLIRGGTYVLVGLLGGQTTIQLPLVTLTARTLTGTYVGSLAEMGELMDLVRSGKIDPVPVEARNVSEADKTIKDLASGSINGLVCLKHDH